MKRLKVLSGFTIALLLISSNLLAQNNHKYQSKEGGFEITFPGEYVESQSDNETSTTIKIQCEYNGHNFLASYSIHDFEEVDQEEMAEVSLDAFTDAVDGKIYSKSTWKIKKDKGLKAIMGIQDNAAKLEYRVIIVGVIQYQLVFLGPSDNYDEKMAKKFFNSFKLK